MATSTAGLTPYTGTGSLQTINGQNYSVATPAVGTQGYQTVNGVNYNATVGGGVASTAPSNVYAGGGGSVLAAPVTAPKTTSTVPTVAPLNIPTVTQPNISTAGAQAYNAGSMAGSTSLQTQIAADQQQKLANTTATTNANAADKNSIASLMGQQPTPTQNNATADAQFGVNQQQY